MSREIPGWALLADGRHRCDRCALVIAIADSDPLPIRHACRRTFESLSNEVARSSPSIARKLLNFTVAAIGHFARGAPTCTQTEIDARLAICRACPFFSGTTCEHRDCGCRANRQRRFLNKLAWADQACPQNRWGPIARR